MIVKIHKTAEGRKIVAICDNNLIGKRFEEGKLQLDLNSAFYKGKEMGKEEVKELLKEPCIVNIVGEESVNFALQAGIANKKDVLRISNIPHVEAII